MNHEPLAIDLFCGLGGWTEGLLAEGYNVVGFDIEAHVYGEHKYPANLVLQDARTLHGSQFRNATLIVASPPCFVADTLVLTARGLLPISEVMVGDLVLTHRKRWRQVLRAGSTIAPTVVASGYGGQLEGTAEHPIYARRNEGGFSVWDKAQKTPVNIPKKLGRPEWIPLANCGECHWASPAAFAPLLAPPLPNGLADVPEFWWIVGRWVGDGWVRLRDKAGSGDEVIICCGNHEADELGNRLATFAPRRRRRSKSGELHWRSSRERTVTKFHAASNSLARWLVDHFGRGAAMKSWPAWALGMKEESRRALLAGYASADGYEGRNGSRVVIRTSTVSKRLAIGTKLLAASLGYTSNLHFTRRPATCRIEGRVVQQRDTWTASWIPSGEINRLVERADGLLWGKVRDVKPACEAARVWNLEVDEDNSYTANGIVVHNCQEFSYMAMPWTKAKEKKRRIEADPNERKRLTALFDACFRIQREACEAAGRHIPMVVENVCGAQPWVGKAQWHFGSYYLWGDVPALMPITCRRAMKYNPDGTAHPPGSWFAISNSKNRGQRSNSIKSGNRHEFSGEKLGWKSQANGAPMRRDDGIKSGNASERLWKDRPVESQRMDEPRREGYTGVPHKPTGHWTNSEENGIKQGGDWFNDSEPSIIRLSGSKPKGRKFASAMIAKIPEVLARYIARVYRPQEVLE